MRQFGGLPSFNGKTLRSNTIMLDFVFGGVDDDCADTILQESEQHTTTATSLAHLMLNDAPLKNSYAPDKLQPVTVRFCIRSYEELYEVAQITQDAFPRDIFDLVCGEPISVEKIPLEETSSDAIVHNNTL